MGAVVPFRNMHCNLHRMQELQAIGMMMTEVQELYGSLRFWTLPHKRVEILTRAHQVFTEARRRHALYFASLGQEMPPLLLCNLNK